MITSEIDVADFATTDTRLDSISKEVIALKKQVEGLKQDNTINIICFSGEWDRLFASLTIASGALAMGMEVHLFFTFWAVSALRSEDQTNNDGKSFLQSMFGRMLPCGAGKAPLSKFNFWGLGKCFIRHIMREKGIDDIDVLYQEVMDLGAHLHVCETSTILFGIKCDDLMNSDKLNQCGVTTFLARALKSRMTLFI
jgi:peroxiredoxin family protein